MSSTSSRVGGIPSRERSGVSRMPSPRHSRNSIPFHNSRRRPCWGNSLKPGSHNRSRSYRSGGRLPQVAPSRHACLSSAKERPPLMPSALANTNSTRSGIRDRPRSRSSIPFRNSTLRCSRGGVGERTGSPGRPAAAFAERLRQTIGP